MRAFLKSTFLFSLAGFLSVPVHADRLLLRSGVVYYNVKTRPQGNSHIVFFRNGRRRIVMNREIRRLRLRPVYWLSRKRSDAIRLRRKPPPKDRVHHIVLRTSAIETTRKKKSTHKRQKKTGRIAAYKKQPGSKRGSTSGNRSPYELTPVGRSFLLPGWGQYSLGRTGRAYAYGGGFVLFFAYYYQQNGVHARAQAAHNDPVPTALLAGYLPGTDGILANYFYLEGKKGPVVRAATRGNRALLFMGLLWLWNVLDAYFETGSFRLWSTTIPSNEASTASRDRSLGIDAGYRVSGMHIPVWGVRF